MIWPTCAESAVKPHPTKQPTYQYQFEFLQFVEDYLGNILSKHGTVMQLMDYSVRIVIRDINAMTTLKILIAKTLIDCNINDFFCE